LHPSRLVIFSCSRPHPHLHSFPTRRSSDLDAGSADPCPPFREPMNAVSHALDFGDLRRVTPIDPMFGGGRGKPVDRHYIERFLRSEEHTSELQSQSNLVCRLLLEKKKKKKQ